MQTWERPQVPLLPGSAPTLQLRDSLTGAISPHLREELNLWVCGITPYDATHLGHANTYVFFDILVRVWIDGGRKMRYAQNLTDIDDPLFERAHATGVDWKNLAHEQTELFRQDMRELRVIPPHAWVSVSEKLDDLEQLVRAWEENAGAYRLPNDDGSEDIYVDSASDVEFVNSPYFSDLDLAALFDGHGGDSQRVGKRNPLDPLVWKGVRGTDYRPPSKIAGQWRPGWHIECAAIAKDELGTVDVQGGGSDLLFPHHEMSELHLRAINSQESAVATLAQQKSVAFHVHSAMVSYQGTKMSKSLGNLILVSQLIHTGVDPRAIRLTILSHHYRQDWEYTDAVLERAQKRLAQWNAALEAPFDECAPEHGMELLQKLRKNLAYDLDTPAALAAVDDCLAHLTAWHSEADKQLVIDTIDALLGVKL
ncbi:hypothetical protein [Arcanobacterium bovis]|uniref:tRNA synthetases class I catalytic domain-containing protein n=1 Tax=Arcanobacterium bovis TaxID=2529275 RepID=A0A4Q9V310_9ACTO|nr:hypothetical protein [Arcanobacterium bovis]TBW22977.1 hypothetical protein EZJ44_03560 [Arcanobacterium bovis]